MTGSNKVILWNSAGIRAGTESTSSKFNFFDSQFPNAHFAIAAFVETHHKDSQDFSQDFGQCQHTHHILDSPATNETHSGILLLISKDFEISQVLEPIPGRIFNLRLKKLDQTLNLSVFYGPQWGKMKKEDILDVLGKRIYMTRMKTT